MMSNTRTPLHSLLLSFGVALTLQGCASSEEAPAVPEGEETIDLEAAAASGGSVFANAFVEGFEETWEAHVASSFAQDGVRSVLATDELPANIRRRSFLSMLYEERGWTPAFTNGSGLAPNGEYLRSLFASEVDHAFEEGAYNDEAFRELTGAYLELSSALDGRRSLTLTAEEREAVIELIAESDAHESNDPGSAAMELILSEQGPASLRAAHAEMLENLQAHRGAQALIDVLIADRVLSWSYDMKYFNVVHLEDASEDERLEYTADGLATTFRAFADASDLASTEALANALEPRRMEYRGLMAERARYAAIVEAGGWNEVRRRDVSAGRSHPRIAELKQRLQIEGYYPEDAPIDEVFDEVLQDSVRTYQETHQLDVDGSLSRSGFWSSLNVPAARRLAQIELTLQRWRENRIGDDEYYVHVNIPDFHAEVWNGDERELRYRIVVGNLDQVCDPETNQIRYANATPIQTATMTYVVLNPHWNVPRRIVEEELLPALLEDPLYFETMGFEEFTTPGGFEIIRQRPGPQNPLGVVKFMFPNPHNTYMHDTAKPEFFRYTMRAFSHGCMRVHEPLTLLEHILTNDGKWDEERIAAIFESQEETSITLNNPIPVHVEYYVVRIDDNGRANFLSDVYRYDRDRLNPPDPESLECEPEPESALRLIIDETTGAATYTDAEGNLFAPDSAEAIRAVGPPPGMDEETAQAILDAADAIADPLAGPGSEALPLGTDAPVEAELPTGVQGGSAAPPTLNRPGADGAGDAPEADAPSE